MARALTFNRVYVASDDAGMSERCRASRVVGIWILPESSRTASMKAWARSLSDACALPTPAQSAIIAMRGAASDSE